MTPEDDLNYAEFRRLIDRGLPASIVLRILNGEIDEDFEVARVETTDRAREWCAGLTALPQGLQPRWDLVPERFYLALDGESPGHVAARSWVLIHANAAEVLDALTYISTRDQDPWHKEYRDKSCRIAYRWSVNLSVTPPLLTIHNTLVHIVGGMHRFHLALACGMREMPFLVEPDAQAEIVALLPSARAN